MMTLDENILEFCGGLRNNSLKNVLDISDDVGINAETNMIKHSSYYDTDNFVNLLKSKKTSFILLSTNIESINSKFSELEIFIKELRDQKCELDVICLQESWLSNNDSTDNLNLDGFNIISQGKSCSNKGGLMFYIRDEYCYKIVSQHNTDLWEGLFIEICGGGLKKPIVLGNIYRPPRNLLANYRTFVNELKPILSSLDSQNKKIFYWRF